MFRKRLAALAVVITLTAAPAAAATTDEELKELRAQFLQLKEQYESRLQALEERLRQAERAVEKPRTAEARVAAAPAATPAARPGPDASFNPAISLILNGTYARSTQDPGRYQISGFVPSMGEVGPRPRNFSLGESELAFSANIDPYFRGMAVAALTADDEVEVEEANIQTLALGHGLTVKAGRIFSSIGYVNEIHAHAWDFADAPLVNSALLGGRYAEDGVQLRWVAPTDLYFDLGAELGRGRTFPAGPNGGRNKNGAGAANVFAHLGGDIGTDLAWQAGVSYLHTSPQDRAYEDLDSTGTTVSNRFTGRSRLWTLSGVLKWSPHGDSSRTSLKLQGEYFRSREAGLLTYDADAASLGTQTGDYGARPSGWYGQAVYQFMPRWRVGYRHDRLDPGSPGVGLVQAGLLTPADFPVLASHRPSRNTLMVDWTGSEFSRLRLQLARERSRLDVTDNQFLLQYIMSLGAHGAHRF